MPTMNVRQISLSMHYYLKMMSYAQCKAQAGAFSIPYPLCNTSSHQELQQVILRLENDTVELRNWFAENFMKLNEEKCHLLVFGEEDTEISIHVGPSVIKESNEEKLLGVIIDRKLNFK